MKNKKIVEDMLAPADSPSFVQTPIHQIPATASPEDNMDMFALAGPSKSKTTNKSDSKKDKGIESKTEPVTFPSSKVLTFQDFINQKKH